jgi:DNA-binding NtrC family response regulator
MSGEDATDARSRTERDGRDGPATVLVVDDEPAIRRFVARALAKDLDIVEAGDGRSAIDVVRADSARLVLLVCDLSLPDFGGEEVIRAARALRPDLAIVVMTGWDPWSAADALGDAGPVGWLAKPFTAAHLREVVDATLAAR